MARLNHPFIIKMRGVSQDNRNMFILMDYLPQGELMNVLKIYKRMSPELCRFYTAQVLLCFEYLHSNDYIYRDLKPENVLVQNSGFIKLTDFGFLKKLAPHDRTYTLCGTPEYMAPEVIMNTGHGQAADWYTLGIFMYELLVGRPPFMHNDTYEVFKMTLRTKIPFPTCVHADAKSLIKHLTAHDLSKRYGHRVAGVNEIKNHRFFSTTHW